MFIVVYIILELGSSVNKSRHIPHGMLNLITWNSWELLFCPFKGQNFNSFEIFL